MSDLENQQLQQQQQQQQQHPEHPQLAHTEPIPQEREMVVKKQRTADPGTLGLFAFASTLLIWSLYNLQTRRVTHPNFIVGMAIFTGGVAMILAGMWAFPRGDAFCATMFVLYGAFWLSYAAILIPGTGILAAYALELEFRNALGIYLAVWAIVTFWLLVTSFLRNWVYPVFLVFLMITFWLLCAGAFLASVGTIKAGGVFGCITAFVGYGCGLVLLITEGKEYEESTYISLGKPIWK